MSVEGPPAQAPPDRTQAPFAVRALEVTTIERLGPYVLVRAADPDSPKPDPGQFAMLRTERSWGGDTEQEGRPYLPRACSYARHLDGEAHFLLEDVGPGTRRLCELEIGERLCALGPLGSGFRAPARGATPILVGGGIGIAPLAILHDELEREGHRARVLCGFRDGECARGAVILDDPEIATDDGSFGHHGQVTELLRAELEKSAGSYVYACGPAGMLEAIRALCVERNVDAQLALEAPMACGFGACFGCVVPRADGGYLRVCLDGPVLDAHDLGALAP